MPHPKGPVRRHKKLIFFLIATITLITWMNPNYSFLTLYYDHGQLKRLIQPPQLTEDDLKSLLNSTRRKQDILGDIVKRQITKMQDSSNCLNGHTLSCGHDDKCGLGCQIHHRSSCLMISYAMNIPLIHDEEGAWPFSNPWGDAFQPLGSKCSKNENTIDVKWRSHNIPLLYIGKWCHYMPIMCPKDNQYEFPLKTGIPVSTELDSLIKENVQNPFLWLAGQFILITTELSAKQKKIVEDAKNEMQLDSKFPLVGLHVRRTDKIREAIDSRHEIEEYVQAAQEFFNDNKSLTPRTIFVASDDHTVLKEFQERYSLPTWRIVGMKSEHTFTEQWERSETLHEIVRDVKILSECDYIVCGLSSNICRLLYEVIAGQKNKNEQRLKSLDGDYEYVLKDFVIPNALVATRN